MQNNAEREHAEMMSMLRRIQVSIDRFRAQEHQQHLIFGGQYWHSELQRRRQDPLYLDGFGYKVFSQNDEDGILHEIFRRIGTTNRRFIEFGLQDGLQCNTYLLLMLGWGGSGWKGATNSSV